MPTGSNDNTAAALARCRDLIDDVDRRLIDLFNERATIVTEIGRIKKENQMAIYEPKREMAVFENVTAHNRGPLTADAAKRIFERIIDEMRKVQKDRMEEEKTQCS